MYILPIFDSLSLTPLIYTFRIINGQEKKQIMFL